MDMTKKVPYSAGNERIYNSSIEFLPVIQALSRYHGSRTKTGWHGFVLMFKVGQKKLKRIITSEDMISQAGQCVVSFSSSLIL